MKGLSTEAAKRAFLATLHPSASLDDDDEEHHWDDEMRILFHLYAKDTDEEILSLDNFLEFWLDKSYAHPEEVLDAVENYKLRSTGAPGVEVE